MKRAPIIFLILILSCNESNNVKINKVTQFDFRISYIDLENEKFKNKTDSIFEYMPEATNNYNNDKFYNALEKLDFIKNNRLNYQKFAKQNLEQFTYKLNQNERLNTKIQFIKSKTENINYEITFDRDNGIIKDTLKFNPLTNVSFSVMDINNDGKSELITLSNYYIMGGENYELSIYELK